MIDSYCTRSSTHARTVKGSSATKTLGFAQGTCEACAVLWLVRTARSVYIPCHVLVSSESQSCTIRPSPCRHDSESHVCSRVADADACTTARTVAECCGHLHG